jgi:alcohol dehydrogenase class IV
MWYFSSPQVVFGEDALHHLAELAGRRAFIVTDPNLHRMGFTDRVAEPLRGAGLEVAYFTEVEPMPSLETVHRGAAAITAFEPDWIIGLGGGSAMDAAKAMWILYERPEIALDGLVPWLTLGLGRKAQLITIPTTSGTGSEATWAFVLTDTAEQRKMGLGLREATARLAIVDPSLTRGLPPRITADTGMDALTHAIEGYTSKWHNDFSDGLCLKAAQLVFDYLARAVADGEDLEAREKMANAAAIAGLGFGNSMAALAHALGHALEARFHQPHGRCVGLYLPYTIEYVAAGGDSRYADVAYHLRLPAGDEMIAARALAAAIRDLQRRIGQPTRVADMGIRAVEHEAALERLCDLAEMDTQIVVSARVPERRDLAALFRSAFERQSIVF